MSTKQVLQSKGRRASRQQRILLADDGSSGAAAAREFALTLAAARGARLMVVFVRQPVESDEDARRMVAPTLEAAAAAGLKCDVIIQRPVGISNTGRRILAAATSVEADVIVLGARGAGLVRKLLGSVSSYVVSRARVSVCVVR